MSSFGTSPRGAVRWEAVGDEVLVLDADATHVHRLSRDTARAAKWALTHPGESIDDAPDELRPLIGALIDTGIIPTATVVDPRVRWSRRRLLTMGSAGLGVVSLALPSSAAAASGDGVVDPNDTAPQTVGAITRTSGITTVQLSWVDLGEITYYRVYYRPVAASHSDPPPFVDVPGGSVVLTNLTPLTTYEIWIVSYNDRGPSPASATIQVSTLATAPPTGTTADSTTTTITFSWNAVAGASEYRVVYWRTGHFVDAVTVQPSPVTATTLTVTDLQHGEEYAWYVQAKVNGVWSAAPAENDADTIITDLSAASVALTPGPTYMGVAWASVSNASSYLVMYKKSSDSTFTSAGSTPNQALSITGLIPNTSYDVYVVASNALTTAPASTTQTASTVVVPAVGIPSATAGVTTLDISWTAVSVTGTPWYTVYYRAGSSGAASSLTATTSTSAQITGLVPDTSYEVWVTTTLDGYTSAASPTRTVSTSVVPAPGQPSATASTTTSLTIGWTAVAGSPTYEVFYRTGSDAYASAGTTSSTSLVISSLVPNTSYDFYVTATISGKTSADSTSNSASTTALTAPGQPTVTPALTSLAVSWTAVAGVTGYEVFYKVTADSTYTSAGTTTAPTVTLTISSLTPGVSYDVYVVTTLSGASSAASTVRTASTLSPTAPGQPTVTVTFDTATVSWTAVSGAGSYEVFYRTGVDAYASAGTTSSTSLAVGSLTPGTAYDFYVTTIVSGVSSSASTVRAATTASQSALSSATQSGLTVTWTAVSGATGYEVWARTGANAYTSRGTTNAATLTLAITGLIPETSYDVYVIASLASGSSTSNTRTASTTAVTAPGAPTLSSVTATGLTATWTAVSGVTGYEVFYKAAADSGYTSAGTTTAPTVTLAITGLVPNTAYTVYVTATLSGKSSAAGTTASATTAVPTAPGAPTVTSTFNTASVSWTAVSGASSYEVFYRTGAAGFASAGTTSSTSLSISSLSANTAYDYYVTTIISGVSSAAGTSTANTTAALAAPTAGVTTLACSWPAITGATNYEVWARTGTDSFTKRSTDPLTATSFTITGLSPEVAYDVYVIATTAGGNETSNTRNATTLAIATGGSRTADGDFWVHTFTAAGNFVLNIAATVDYLIVGGGGGGARGGGGGGGVISATGVSLASGSRAITVGAGGAGGKSTGTAVATTGGSTTFNGLTAGGGGGGHKAGAGANGVATNGSGGGAGHDNTSALAGGTSTGGGAGGGIAAVSPKAVRGGGGGGAGGAGATSSGTSSATVGGTGGLAVSSSITGTALTYAGGGGGYGVTPGGSGNGTAGYGDGGDGASDGAGAAGKAGVVIIRYSKTPAAAPRPIAPLKS